MLLYWGSRRCVPGDPPTNTLSWLPRHSHAGLLETLPLCRAHKDRQRSAAFSGHKRGRAGSTALQPHLTLPNCRAQVPPNPSHLRRARSPGLRAPASSRTPPFATRAAPTLGLGLKASFLSRRLGRHPAAAARAAPGRARRRRAAAVPPGPAQRQPRARPRRGPVQSAVSEPGQQGWTRASRSPSRPSPRPSIPAFSSCLLLSSVYSFQGPGADPKKGPRGPSLLWAPGRAVPWPPPSLQQSGIWHPQPPASPSLSFCAPPFFQEPGMQAKNISRFQTQEARLATPSAPKTRESEP